MFNDTLSASAKQWFGLYDAEKGCKQEAESDGVRILFDSSMAQVHAVS